MSDHPAAIAERQVILQWMCKHTLSPFAHRLLVNNGYPVDGEESLAAARRALACAHEAILNRDHITQSGGLATPPTTS